MVSHGADVPRQHFFVPLDPFIIIDVTLFTLTEFSAMHNTAPFALFDRNHDVQTFVIDNACNCIQRTVRGIVTTADANEVKVLARHRILAHRMETEPAHAIAPCNTARERSIEISVVNCSQHIC